jgi:hypothetical protein
MQIRQTALDAAQIPMAGSVHRWRGSGALNASVRGRPLHMLLFMPTDRTAC